MLKKLLLSLLVLGLLFSQAQTTCFAEDTEETADVEASATKDKMLIYDRADDINLQKPSESERGPLTSHKYLSYPWAVVSMPLRIITMAAGAGVGGAHGAAVGMVGTEKKYLANTWGKVKEDPLMLPVGFLAVPLGLTVGFFEGIPHGAHRYGSKGYFMWDHL